MVVFSFFQPYTIQQIQLAEVDWESDIRLKMRLGGLY